jgi:hypothetical protein
MGLPDSIDGRATVNEEQSRGQERRCASSKLNGNLVSLPILLLMFRWTEAGF